MSNKFDHVAGLPILTFASWSVFDLTANLLNLHSLLTLQTPGYLSIVEEFPLSRSKFARNRSSYHASCTGPRQRYETWSYSLSQPFLVIEYRSPGIFMVQLWPAQACLLIFLPLWYQLVVILPQQLYPRFYENPCLAKPLVCLLSHDMLYHISRS